MQPDELERALSAAGDRARSAADASGRPDAAFGRDLRDTLLAQLPTPGAGEPAAHGPRVRWSFPLPRLVPLGAAGVLLLAGAVAARQLYVAMSPDATPTPAPTVAPTPESEATPDATLVPLPSLAGEQSAAPTSAPTSAPTAEPTPAPTPKPEPTAEPTPSIGELALSATTCHGGVVLDWSVYGGDGFNHYTTLRNTSAYIPLAYPPQGGAVDFGGTYSTWAEKSSAVDTSADPGVTYYYRSMAFNAEDQVIAASDVVSAMAKPVKTLGALEVTSDGEGTLLSWTPYPGPGDCFSFMKIAYSKTDPTPSYLEGDPYLAALSSQSQDTFTTFDLEPGQTYYIRVQVIRSTDLGGFLVAQTEVATYTVP